MNCPLPAAKRRRAESIRQTVKDAIRHEYERIREAYRFHPDSTADADGLVESGGVDSVRQYEL